MIVSFKRGSVFTKLLLTYIIAIFVATLGIGISSYTMSTRLYNQQIEQGSAVLLNQYKGLVETRILSVAERTAANLAGGHKLAVGLDKFFIPDQLDYRAVYNIHESMGQYLIDSSGTIEDIQLLNTNKNVILSCIKGISLMQTHLIDQTQSDWIGNVDYWAAAPKWSAIYFDDSTVVSKLRFMQCYPATASEQVSGYIAVDISASVLSDLLESLNCYQDGILLLLDGDGSIIQTTQKGTQIEQSALLDDMFEIQGGGHVFHGENDTYYFTYSLPFKNGWRIAMLTPVSEFYASSLQLQQSLLKIFLLCVIAGVLLSLLFASRMYSPVKAIMSKLRQTLAPAQTDKNEYTFINNAILHLNSTVSELNHTLEQNQPVLKCNIVLSLINRTLTEHAMLEQRLDLIGFQPGNSYYTAINIRLSSYLLDILDEKTLQFFKFELIQQLEICCNQRCIISEYRYNEIVALVCHDNMDITGLIKDIKTCLIKNPRGSIYMAVGSLQEDPLLFWKSYAHANEALDYAYFRPAQLVFFHTDLANLSAPEEDIIDEQIQKFNKQIHSSDIQGAMESLDTMVQMLTESPYSYSYMQKKLMELIRVFAKYNKELNLEAKFEVEDFDHRFNDADNINTFAALFREMIKNTLETRDQHAGQKNENIINTICVYVEQHLSDDLSLGKLARSVGLSGGHLSRLFKEATRLNIVDYITSKRMKKAQELIVDTSLNIEEIASRVGYMTPHYFCRKFKETYGYTPSHYRSLNLNKDIQ